LLSLWEECFQLPARFVRTPSKCNGSHCSRGTSGKERKGKETGRRREEEEEGKKIKTEKENF
jgi:hypothetical protein